MYTEFSDVFVIEGLPRRRRGVFVAGSCLPSSGNLEPGEHIRNNVRSQFGIDITDTN